MSTPFSNPWSNPHNPVDMYRRYRRRKDRGQAQSAPAPAPAADHRTQEVNDNRAYASKTAGNAQAQQDYFEVLTGPWSDFLFPTSPKAPKSRWPRSKTGSAGTPGAPTTDNSFNW